MGMPAPGEPGAVGYYNYGINSKDDVICYDIVLKGVTGDYQSAAKTATHIHQSTPVLASRLLRLRPTQLASSLMPIPLSTCQVSSVASSVKQLLLGSYVS